MTHKIKKYDVFYNQIACHRNLADGQASTKPLTGENLEYKF